MIDTDRIPRHIAIIMDGNGRWAEARGQNRSKGHQAGAESVDKITAECARLGVKYLTLYTFSTENWNRPPAEVEAIMQLLLSKLVEETFMKNNVRLRIIGDRSRVAPHVMKAIEAMAEAAVLALQEQRKKGGKWRAGVRRFAGELVEA